MPTTNVMTFSSTRLDPLLNPDDALASLLHVQLAASTTFAAGTVLGEVTATPGTYAAYTHGNMDGTQNPAVILQYPATTDSDGLITNASEWGATNGSLTAPAYTQGVFRCEDLTGFDTYAVEAMNARLLQGDHTSGIVSIG